MLVRLAVNPNLAVGRNLAINVTMSNCLSPCVGSMTDPPLNK